MAGRSFRLLVASCALGCASSGSAHADDLLQVWRAAQQRDPPYVAARQSLQIAQQRFGLGRTQALPALGADAAPARLRQARERLRLAEQDLALRVARSYFDTLAARQVADLALAQLNLMAQQLRWAQRAETAGSAAAPRDAQQRFDQARALRVAATRELEQRRGDMEKLAGLWPRSLHALPPEAPLWRPEPADAGYWAAKATDGHPRVRMQQAVMDAAGEEVARRRDGGSPNVDVTASRQRIFGDENLQTPAEIGARARSQQLGLVLTVPLADTGPDSQVREAMAVQERTEADLQAERGLASGRARAAFAAAVQALAQADALAAAARAGRVALETAQASLSAGARVPAELLAAVQQSFAAEREWIHARADAVLQGLALKAAAGTLAERDVAEVNALLAPAPRSDAARP